MPGLLKLDYTVLLGRCLSKATSERLQEEAELDRFLLRIRKLVDPSGDER